jgi:hypothetical protein
MPDVKDGLEIGVQTSPAADFEHALAEAVGRERGNDRAAVAENATTAEIYEQVLGSSGTDGGIEGGLEFAEDPFEASERRRLEESRKEIEPDLERARQELEAEKSGRDELAAFRRAAEVDKLFATLEDAPDEGARAAAWAALSAEDRQVAVESGLVGDTEAPELTVLGDFIRAELEREDQAKQAAETLSANHAKTRELVNKWARSSGLNEEQANVRLEVIQLLAQQYLGFNLEHVFLADPEAGAQHLHQLDNAVNEIRRAGAERRFQQEILDTDSRNIGDGMELFTPLGWRKLNETSLGPPNFDEWRAAHRGANHARETQTADELRRSILAEEEKDLGRSIREVYERGTEARKRAREERDREARSVLY